MATDNKYEKQALDFCKKYGVTIRATPLKHDFFFVDDKEKRDVYTIEITRNGMTYEFQFGQSIIHSNGAVKWDSEVSVAERKKLISNGYELIGMYWKRKAVVPTEYVVLSCLTKIDPESFDYFCCEYGYDTDSRKAYAIYESVRDEWYEVKRLFYDCLEELQEIN